MFTEEEVKALWEEHCGPSWILEDPLFGPDLVKFANALPAKREGEPIDRENIREGDLVTGTIARRCNEYSKGGVVEGVVYRLGDSPLFVAGWPINALDDLRLINRLVPPLPTERPAVIRATEVRGVKGEWWLTLDVFGIWESGEDICGRTTHGPEHITSWKPADFVVRES